MAMDLPRFLSFGLTCLALGSAVMAEESVVTSSASSFKQANYEQAIPTEAELDAYEAESEVYYKNEAKFVAPQQMSSPARTVHRAVSHRAAPQRSQPVRHRNVRTRSNSGIAQVSHQAHHGHAHAHAHAEHRAAPKKHVHHATHAKGSSHPRRLAEPRRFSPDHFETGEPARRTAHRHAQPASPIQQVHHEAPHHNHRGHNHAGHQHGQRTHHHKPHQPIQQAAAVEYVDIYEEPHESTVAPAFSQPAGYGRRMYQSKSQNHSLRYGPDPYEIQRVQNEVTEPTTPLMPEPETVFHQPSEVFDSYVTGPQTYATHPYSSCEGCGEVGCTQNCQSGCSYGNPTVDCNCGQCVHRNYRGKHPHSRFKSDYAFADFIEPISNPYWFIDPRSMTRVRLVHLSQDIPANSVTNSGEASVTTLQASLAVSDRLSFLAVKSGRGTIDIDGQGKMEGWLDMAFGMKSVLIRSELDRFLLSAGVLYERSQGTSEIYQGNGHGMWHAYLSMGKGWERSHFLTTLGWHLPNNRDQENESFYYSFHYDYELFKNKFFVWEVNGQKYVENGSRTIGSNVEGGDLFSLGSDNVDGNNVITTALGGTIRLRDDVHFSAAYEFPLTSREDFLEERVIVTLSYSY